MQTPLRAHPITILRNLWRVRFLVIIPVLRGLWQAITWDFAVWLAGAWLDLLILLAMVGFAAWRTRKVSLWWEDGLLQIRTGLLLIHRTTIPWDNIVTVSVTRPFYLRPFGAVRLRLDNIAGSRREADFTFFLSPQAAEQLLKRHGWTPPGQDSFAASSRSVLAQSLLSSNSLAGIIFVAALISQSGRLLGRQLTEEIVGAFEQLTRALAFGLPPAGAAIAYALLGGWVVSSAISYAQYKNMRVDLEGGVLRVAGGALTGRFYSVTHDKISCLEVRQNLLAKLLGLYSLSVSAVGYAKGKADIACLIPAQRAPGFETVRKRFFPRLNPAPNTLTPPPASLLRFILTPCLLCLGIPLAVWLLCLHTESWERFVLFVGGMAMAPALALLTVRIFDFRTGGIGRQADTYTLRYSRGFYLCTVIVPGDKIVQVSTLQSYSQKRGGRCDIIIYTRAEGRAAHRLKGLPVALAREIFA